jgi:hypothetical protein
MAESEDGEKWLGFSKGDGGLRLMSIKSTMPDFRPDRSEYVGCISDRFAPPYTPYTG